MNGGLLILGMHRSGTSALAGQLAAMGFYPGKDLLPPKGDNPKGFFEPRAVVALHEEILKALGSAWDDPRPLPAGWAESSAMAPYRERLKGLIQTEYGGGTHKWLVKDPRLCRLLALWRGVLDELGVAPKILFVVRAPAEVAGSLARRDKTDAEQAAMLWTGHYAMAELDSRGLQRAVVFYEDWLADWRGEAERISDALDLRLDIAAGADGFVEAGLRHEMPAGPAVFAAPQNDWAEVLYEVLLAWRRDGSEWGDAAERAAEDLALSARAALPVLAYVHEADARAHAAAVRDLKAQTGLSRADVFQAHFLAEAERAAAAAQRLAHERLLLIKQMQGSASWRVTRPLRTLKRLLRR